MFLTPANKKKLEAIGPEDGEVLQKNKDEAKKTLLIVEDNTELRSYLKNELSLEYNILEAANGKQGLEMATKRIPDLIITDVLMPQMDGFAFCRALKGNIRTSHIPIITLSAKSMGDDKIHGVNAGADVYLTKPFDMKLLNSYLNRLMENRQIYINKNLTDPNKLNLLEKTTDIDKSFMRKVLDHLNTNIVKSDLNVEHLADDMHLSRSQLYRKIKAMTGLTPNELIRKVRLEMAKKMIENGCESIGEVGFKVGFSSPSYFSRCFKSEFGVLPTELKPR
jgi:YesN/AraC family two-component response regulator